VSEQVEVVPVDGEYAIEVCGERLSVRYPTQLYANRDRWALERAIGNAIAEARADERRKGAVVEVVGKPPARRVG